MKGLKITYSVDSADMTDEQYEDQIDKVFTIGIERLRQMIENEVPTNKGEHIEWAYSDIKVIN